MHLTQCKALTLALCFCTLAPPAAAQSPSQPAAPAPPQPAKPVHDHGRAPTTPPRDIPDLSQLQRDRITRLWLETREKLAPQRERLMGERHSLRALWFADVPSRDAILKRLASIDAIRAAMRPVLVDSRIAYLALLTPQQRTALHRPCQPIHAGPSRPRMSGMDRHEGVMGRHGAEMGPCASGSMDPWADCAMDDDGRMGLEMDACPASKPAPLPEKAPSP